MKISNSLIVMRIIACIMACQMSGFTYAITADPMESAKQLVIPPKTTTLSNGYHMTVTTGESAVLQNPDKTTVEVFTRSMSTSDGSVTYTSDTRVISCTEYGTCNDAAFTEAISNSALSPTGPGVPQGDGKIYIFTTEKIPGANCVCAVDNRDANDIRAGVTLESQCGIITTRKYKCEVSPGLGSFQSLFASIIKYFVNIVLILGVLAIAALGVAWSWAGGDDVKAKSTLKKWGINIVVGLTILFLFQYILKFLAPWAFQ